MEEAYRSSYNVTVPFDVLPLLCKEQSFEKEYKMPAGRENDFLIYQIGGSNVIMKCDPMALRRIWAAACERVTGERALLDRMPLLRCGSGFLVSSLNPQCYNDQSGVRARLSIDFDCTDKEKPFPVADHFFSRVCDFLDDRVVHPEKRSFHDEEASLFLGSNNVKQRSAHLIFHNLCWQPEMSNFVKKSSPIAKAFTKQMTDEFGLDADIGIKGLKWEFMDKRDKTEWRECVLPLTRQFNLPEEDATAFPLFQELAHQIDPHVLPTDRAWHRTCVWKPVPQELVQASKAKSSVQSKTRALESTATSGSLEERLKAAFPILADATFAVKDDGTCVVTSTHCPLKKNASDNAPAFHHSAGGKFYARGEPGANMFVNCVICQEPVTFAVRTAQYPDVLQDFDANWVRIADRALYIGQYRNPDENLCLLTRERFTNHVWACSLNAKGALQINGKLVRRSDYWWELTEQMYTGLMYAPPPARVPQRMYNTWNGFNPDMLAVAATMDHMTDEELGAEWGEMRDHLFYNICNSDKNAFAETLKFFGDIVQQPGRRPKWGICVWGPQGAGKGLMMSFFEHVVGHHNYCHGDAKTLGESFNGDIMDKLLIFSDEGVDGDSKSADRYLKKLMTEDRQQVRQKFMVNRETTAYMRVVVSANDEPTWIKPGDRRWFVLYADIRQPGGLRNRDIAAEIYSLRGPAAFYLMAKRTGDNDGFNPWEAPKSNEKTEIMINSFTPMQRFFHSLLQESAVLVPVYHCKIGLEAVFPPDCGHGDFWEKVLPKDMMLQAVQAFMSEREHKAYTLKRIWREIYMIVPMEHWNARQVMRNNVRVNVFTMPAKTLFIEHFARHFRLETEQLTQVDPLEFDE